MLNRYPAANTMKRIHHETSYPVDPRNLAAGGAVADQPAVTGRRAARPASQTTTVDPLTAIRERLALTGLPCGELSAQQAERRDELLDRGLPYTWRCCVDGQTMIMREHPGGRLEQMVLVGCDTLKVVRVLRMPH